MPAGRPRKPTNLRVLQGNPSGRPINGNEPKPELGIPSIPRHLDKGARTEFKRVSGELHTLGLLTHIDRAALSAYCAAYSRWAAAEDQIAKFGLVIKSPKSGYPIANPYVGIANSALALMHKFLSEFGMTPSSRARLSVETAGAGEDAFEKFMQGIGASDEIGIDTTLDEPAEYSG